MTTSLSPRASKSTSTRNLAIDRFRGILVILMIIGDYMSGMRIVPDSLKHAPDVGLTVADLVALAFVFVIGLTYGQSFAARRASLGPGVYRYFGLRYSSLIGIGAIIAAGANMTGQPTDWGVLQAIGVAGLITLGVIRLPTWARFAIGAGLLVAYQLLLDQWMLPTVLQAVHGGLFGAISWAALLILSTAVADVWRRGMTAYVVCCAVLAAAAAATSFFLVPLSKHRVSLSYVLITLAMSAVIYLGFELAARVVAARPGPVSWWGENALVLYVVHLLLLGAVVTPPVDWWYVDAPWWLAVVQAVAILGLMTVVAWRLHLRTQRA